MMLLHNNPRVGGSSPSSATNNSILFKIEKLNYLEKNNVNKIPQKLEKKIKSKYLKLNGQMITKISKNALNCFNK